MPYEVQIYTCYRTWKNACTYDEGNGLRNEVFATSEAAQAALDELLADITADSAAGFSPPWRLDHFRITHVAEASANANKKEIRS